MPKEVAVRWERLIASPVSSDDPPIGKYVNG